jgi:exopolysaccharide production protein ExoQ
MKIAIHKLEFYWHIFAMLILSGVFFPLWRKVTINQDTYSGDPVLRYILIGTYLVSFLFFLFRIPKNRFKEFYKNRLVWLLLGLVFISALWSSVPWLTLRKAISILFPTIYGILLAVRYPLNKFTKLILIVFAVSLFLSLFIVIIFPNWGLQGYEGDWVWRGIFDHKNRLGRVASLAFLASIIFQIRATKKVRILTFFLIVSSLIVLIFSKSATSLVLSVTMSGFVAVMYYARRTRKDLLVFMIILFLVFGIAALFISSNYEPILSWLGKDGSIADRYILWTRAFHMGSFKPILGYGYSAFWLGFDGPSAYVWEGIHWRPLHGHNGYLDLWLDLGLVGVILLLILMVKLVFKLFNRLILASNESDFNNYLFHLTFCVYMLIYNITESVFLQGEMTNAFYWSWIVYLYAITRIGNTKERVLPNNDEYSGT